VFTGSAAQCCKVAEVAATVKRFLSEVAQNFVLGVLPSKSVFFSVSSYFNGYPHTPKPMCPYIRFRNNLAKSISTNQLFLLSETGLSVSISDFFIFSCVRFTDSVLNRNPVFESLQAKSKLFFGKPSTGFTTIYRMVEV
jgi:hypothetical protein